MRYRLNIDKLINDLVPYTLKGRKYILFIQSLLFPLQNINDRFVLFAKEKHIEARMTSQVIIFEWFLNYKLKKYFVNPTDQITLTSQENLGVPVYHRPNNETFVLWDSSDPEHKLPVFYHKSEELITQSHNFTISCPAISNTQKEEFVYLLSYWVDKYKTAGKTYLIKINN